MQSLEKLTIDRRNHQQEIRELEGQIAQWEEQLSNLSFAGTRDGEEMLVNLRNTVSRVGSIEHKISLIDHSIAWFDRKANSVELMAAYKEKMENWSLVSAP